MWKKVFHRLGKSLLKRKGKVEYKGKHGKKKEEKCIRSVDVNRTEKKMMRKILWKKAGCLLERK